MSGISIILRAKSEAKAAFDRVNGEVKTFSNDQQQAFSGVKAAQEALAKGMRGDLVGAAQSASGAFKALWGVIVSNPLVALVAAAAAAGIALFNLWKRNNEAKEAARQHAKEVASLREELETLTGNGLADKVREQAKALAGDGDEIGLRERIQAVKDYSAALAGLADKQIAEISLMTDEKQIKAAREEYRALADKIKACTSAQKEYETALSGVRAVQEKTAKEEQAASDQAAANLVARIAKERELTLAIEEQFNQYELAAQKNSEGAEADIEAHRKMVARRKELETSDGAVNRLTMERKHILEDIETMMANPAGVDTLAYETALETLRQKELEIDKAKREAAAVTEQEGKDRLAAAAALLASEQGITAEKGKQKVQDPWDKKKADDPWKNRPDPWKDRPNPWKDGKWKDPEFPPVKVPPQPDGGKGGVGGAEPRGQEPWQLTLSRIEAELKGVRADLTGGSGGAS